MRASRLLTLQMLLQSRGRMSARALAEELQVSVRTLHRDVDQLSAAGVPIYAERGRHGGFALLDGWRTSLTGLTLAESQAVFLSGLAGPAGQLGLGGDVKAAQLKLLTALPTSWREQALTVSARLHLDPVDSYRDQEPVPRLGVVAEAVWQERQLSMRYESWKRTSTRTVGPLGLVLKGGAWYLVALLDDQPRTFASPPSCRLRCSTRQRGGLRISTWRPTGPVDEALRARLVHRRGDGARHRCRAARVERARRRAGESRRGCARGPAPWTARVRLRIPIESIAHATGQLLRLSPEVEVLEPEALRESTVARLRQISRLYGLRVR